MLKNGQHNSSGNVEKSRREAAEAQSPIEDINNALIDYYTKLWPYRWIEKILSKAPVALTSRIKSLYSFKNKLLVSTLFVVSGVLIVIGIVLQLIVFPHESLDSRIILDIKAIHFVSSVVIIALGWLFIDRLCKIVSLPLHELTRKADAVSREKSSEDSRESNGAASFQPERSFESAEPFSSNDEIYRLTTSFNRMLTRLKASEARIRDSEARYRFLFDHGPSPIFVIDEQDTRILDVNARAVEEYQFSREELLSMRFPDLALEIDRDQTKSSLEKSISSQDELLPVIQHKRKDGSIFTVNFQATRGAYQGRMAIIAAVWDATEKLEKQARLIHSSKMSTLGEMATGIAHELNQPLYVIRLGCDYLDKRIRSGKELSNEDLRKILVELRGSVERSTRIINHLREFGRKSDDTKCPVDINQTIMNALNLMGKQLESNAILCDLKFDQSVPKILANANRLEQVFVNLLVNARDAILGKEDFSKTPSCEGGGNFIKIQSVSEGSSVIIDFCDSGPGIPEHVKSKIFEPFYTTKKSGEGTGLGLAISYQIVREHKGSIEVVNMEQGGARFRLTFPATGSGDRT